MSKEQKPRSLDPKEVIGYARNHCVNDGFVELQRSSVVRRIDYCCIVRWKSENNKTIILVLWSATFENGSKGHEDACHVPPAYGHPQCKEQITCDTAYAMNVLSLSEKWQHNFFSSSDCACTWFTMISSKTNWAGFGRFSFVSNFTLLYYSACILFTMIWPV
jgi:hypothetical protein